MLREALGDAAERLQVGTQLGSTEAVKHAVAAGLGVSLVLQSAVDDEVRAGSLRALPLADMPLEKSLFVIERDGQPAGAPASRFAESLLRTATGA